LSFLDWNSSGLSEDEEGRRADGRWREVRAFLRLVEVDGWDGMAVAEADVVTEIEDNSWEAEHLAGYDGLW